MMYTVEIEYSDGTRATWFVDNNSIGKIESLLISVAGQPGSIRC